MIEEVYLKKISALKLSFLAFLWSFLGSFFGGILILILVKFTTLALEVPDLPLGGLIVLLILVIPFVSAVLGFIISFVLVALNNLFLSWIGGIKITFEDKDDKSSVVST